MASACPRAVSTAAVSIVNAMLAQDSLGSKLAEVFALDTTSLLLPELLREVVSTNTSQVKEASSLSGWCSFISSIASHSPVQARAQLALVLPHLASNATSVRSAVCSLLGELVAHGKDAQQQQDSYDTAPLVDTLIQRTRDAHTVCRA